MSVVNELRMVVASERNAILSGPWHWPFTVVRNPTIKYIKVSSRNGPAVFRLRDFILMLGFLFKLKIESQFKLKIESQFKLKIESLELKVMICFNIKCLAW